MRGRYGTADERMAAKANGTPPELPAAVESAGRRSRASLTNHVVRRMLQRRLQDRHTERQLRRFGAEWSPVAVVGPGAPPAAGGADPVPQPPAPGRRDASDAHGASRRTRPVLGEAA